MTSIERERNNFYSSLNSQRAYEREYLAKKLGDREQEIFKNEVRFEDGVAKWASNGRCVPMDIAVQYEYLEMPIDLEKHERASNKEMDEFLASYRSQRTNRVRSSEELAEMKNSFGEGTTVVDVLTGETIQL